MPFKDRELKLQSEHSGSKLPFPILTPGLAALWAPFPPWMPHQILLFPGSLPPACELRFHPLSCSGQTLTPSSTALSLASRQLPGRPCCLLLHGILRPALAPLVLPANTSHSCTSFAVPAWSLAPTLWLPTIIHSLYACVCVLASVCVHLCVCMWAYVCHTAMHTGCVHPYLPSCLRKMLLSMLTDSQSFQNPSCPLLSVSIVVGVLRWQTHPPPCLALALGI